MDCRVSRVLIVSARLPVSVVRGASGQLELVPSAGGLASGLRPLHERGETLWIGWPGTSSEVMESDRGLLSQTLADDRLRPVDMTGAEEDEFYGDIANGVLWPLFHYLPERIPLHVGGWDGYEAVNRRFADVVAEAWQAGDVVWVHDYQLLLLPALLRERLPGARIGFFLHIPFPSPDVFAALPQRERLLHGLLGADLIGVHTHGYLRNFMNAVRRFLGLRTALERIRYSQRTVRVGVFPMGIDARGIADRAAQPGIAAGAAEIRSHSAPSLLLGLDRLDYTKGIPRRLLAYEHLLAQHPELHGHVGLTQVAVPSRTQVRAYQRFRTQVDGLVGRINGRFGTPIWTPVRYVYRSISDSDLHALYRAADVMLVTPLRDGMNLVAKEFVASRVDGDGVLVLSEFAGAADELPGALRVNPYDVERTAEAYHRALTMPRDERRRRMARLRDRVLGYDSERWARDFLAAVDAAAEGTPRPPVVDRELAVTRVRSTQHVRLLLDYDGTLVPFTDRPEDTIPDPELLRLLRRLAGRSGTEVHIVSGRARETLDDWFGQLPIGLHAEHGLWSRRAPSGHWHRRSVGPDEWREPVRRVLQRFTERTPGALLEEKSLGLAWHYRNADDEVATWQVNELRVHLAHMLVDQSAEVLDGDRVLEVRPRDVHKGLVVDAVSAAAPPDTLIVAFGDDRTDEQMFAALPDTGIAIAVGARPLMAHLRLTGPADTRRLLREIARS